MVISTLDFPFWFRLCHLNKLAFPKMGARRIGSTSIMDLPDDCLYIIFQYLGCNTDQESFGLACLRWLQIQNGSRKSLQFQCSFKIFNISSLSLSSTKTSDFQLQKLLSRFRHLRSLNLSGCTELSDSGLSLLQHHGSNLLALYLDCCFGITDRGISSIADGCVSLSVISLYRCNVTDIGLDILAKSCSVLTTIDLNYCSSISDLGISYLSQNCHQLQVMKITSCRNVTGAGLKGCSQSLCYIEAESLKLKPEGIKGILSGGGLKYLNLSYPSSCIRCDVLAAIGSGSATRLKILNLRLCRFVRDDSIEAIAKGCPLLEEWNLALCHEITSLGWGAIGSNCCNLERLHVNRCRNLCNEGLKELRDGCMQLSLLYISGCGRVSPTAIELFKFLRGDVIVKEEELLHIAYALNCAY